MSNKKSKNPALAITGGALWPKVVTLRYGFRQGTTRYNNTSSYPTFDG